MQLDTWLAHCRDVIFRYRRWQKYILRFTQVSFQGKWGHVLGLQNSGWSRRLLNTVRDKKMDQSALALAFPQLCLALASLWLLCVLGEMSESRAKRVRIKEVDGWTLRMLIDYVYTAEIQVTEENVQVRENASCRLPLYMCQFFKSEARTHSADAVYQSHRLRC